MTDDRRDRDALGSAPTTPGPPSPKASEQPFASGSTVDMPPEENISSPGELSIGAKVGHFILRRRLGQGGMGVVFAGEDTELGRPVALKLVRAGVDNPAYRARLRREAQALARLEHPNVVKVYEVGSDGDRVFVAMELVDGETLSAWLRAGRAWPEILAMFGQVGNGLAAVHRAGLVHRDFKPDNVLVDHDGRARVADFGLARLDRDEASPIAVPLTQTGAMMGTPGYMAPEQQFGGNVDARADQYSFCVALREALGGRPLDDARWNLVPATVRAAVGRGLSYDASERFASLDELLAALRAAPVRTSGRGVPLAIGAIVAVAAIAVVVVMATSKSPPREAPIVATGSAVVVPPPVVMQPDAAMIAMVVDAGVTTVPIDARTRVAHADARLAPDAAPVEAVAVTTGGSGQTSIPITVPTTKHLAAAVVGDPGHLPILRAAIQNLGYKGIDLSKLAQLEKEMTTTIATAKGIELGVAQVKLGMIKRRRGDCDGALDLWRDSGKTLRSDYPDPAPVWNTRASLGITLCYLAKGDAQESYHTVMVAAGKAGDHDEVKLVMAFIQYEMGDKDDAYLRLLAVEHSPDSQVQAALKVWLDGYGLGLRGG